MNQIIGEHLNKSFGDRNVLHDISMCLQTGEILGIIGPSGAGKTTLIQIIMGMVKADSGNCEINGKAVPNRGVYQDIGYMAQSDALYETLSAKANLTFFGSMFQMDKQLIEERIQKVSNLVSLQDELNKRVSVYSGGMKRRLSLAIALLHDPKIFILDEPTVGIDPKLRQEIWKELNDLKAEGHALIVTTHVMDEAEKCDRLLLLREGRLVAQGTPDELKKAYHCQTIEEVFLKAGDEDAN